jgi:hypothetical protein
VVSAEAAGNLRHPKEGVKESEQPGVWPSWI